MSCAATVMIVRLVDEVGPVLAGRPDAARLRERVVDAAAAGEAVVDLAGVEAVSPSFADEFFGKLSPELVESGAVRFEHLTPELDKIVRTVVSVRTRLNGS